MYTAPPIWTHMGGGGGTKWTQCPLSEHMWGRGRANCANDHLIGEEWYSLFGESHISRTGVRVGSFFTKFSQSQELFFLPSEMSSSVNVPQSQVQGGLQSVSQNETFHEPSFQTLSTLLASLNYSSSCNFQNTSGDPDGFCNLMLHLLKWLKRL